MDIATIIGLASGSGLVLLAIFLGGSFITFIDIPSLLIVGGGTIATTFIKFSMKEVIGTIKVALKAFFVKVEPPEVIIERMVEYAKIARKDGLLALEKEQPGDDFTAKTLRFLSDGYDSETIEDILSRDMNRMVERHMTGQKIFKGMGASAPAFGMIGTLIGLVQMLSSMSDPSKIGGSMAVALLTTLYGALIANVVCIPLAEKLEFRSQEELKNRTIVQEGAVGILKNLHPTVLEESLKVFLAPKEREKVSSGKK